MVNSVLVFTLITAGKYTKQVSQQFISHDMNVKSNAKDDAKYVHKKSLMWLTYRRISFNVAFS